jgi:hypothetical protein
MRCTPRRALENSVGFDLRTMSAQGLEDRTVVVFNADHGEMPGDHGLLLELLGVAAPPGIQGRSLFDKEPKTAVFAEFSAIHATT